MSLLLLDAVSPDPETYVKQELWQLRMKQELVVVVRIPAFRAGGLPGSPFSISLRALLTLSSSNTFLFYFNTLI